MAKYRVTSKMPANAEGYKTGDIIEYDPEVAALSLAKGYIEQIDIEEGKNDKQLRKYNRKA